MSAGTATILNSRLKVPVTGVFFDCFGKWGLKDTNVANEMACNTFDYASCQAGVLIAYKVPKLGPAKFKPMIARIAIAVAIVYLTGGMVTAQPRDVHSALKDLDSDHEAIKNRADKYLIDHYKSAKEAMIVALDCPTNRFSDRLGYVFYKVGPAAIPDLVGAFRGASAPKRANLSYALANFGADGKSAIDELHRHIRDDNPNVRIAVIYAVGEMQDPRSAMPLANCLKDPKTEVRCAVLEALTELGRDAHPATPAVIQLLKSLGRLENSIGIWSSSVSCLASIGKNAVPLLEKEILDKRNSIQLRRAFLESLGFISLQQRKDAVFAVPTLLKAITDPDHQIREEALVALQTICYNARTPEVQKSLNGFADPDLIKKLGPIERLQAADALAAFPQYRPIAIPNFREALQSGDDKRIEFAVDHCSNLGNNLGELAGPLRLAINHRNEEIRQTAIRMVSDDLRFVILLRDLNCIVVSDKSKKCRELASTAIARVALSIGRSVATSWVSK